MCERPDFIIAPVPESSPAGPPNQYSLVQDVMTIVNADLQRRNSQSGASQEDPLARRLLPVVAEVIQTVAHELENEDPHARLDAVRSLDAMSRLVDARLFIQATHDPQSYVRSAAAVALSHFLPSKRTINALLKCLTDENEQVIGAAAFAAGELGAVEAVPLLIELLGDADPKNRIAAVIALGDIGDQRAVTRLSEQQRDTDPEISVRARQALRKIAAKSESSSRI